MTVKTVKIEIPKITDPGAIEKLTTPATEADLSQRERFVEIALALKEALSPKLNPGRIRAASLCAPQIKIKIDDNDINTDVSMFVMRYVPEGQTEPVWRAFVNPSVKPVEGAELVVDRNFSLSMDGIRGEIMRPHTVKLRALAFEIPTGIPNEEDIKHACLENMCPDYQEVLRERELTDEERAREGLRKSDTIGRAFIAQFSINQLEGISPIHHVPEEQFKAFLNDPKGFSWDGPGMQQIFAAGPYCEAKGYRRPPDDFPSAEALAVLYEFYCKGRQRLLAQNAGHAPKGNVEALKP